MKLILFFYAFISFIIIIDSYIVFPLKTLSKENYVFSKDYSEISTIKKYFYSDIYTTLQIGDVPQKIPIFLSISKSIFQITSSLSSISILFNQSEIYNFQSLNKNNNIYFNQEKSDSFQYNNEINSQNKKQYLVNDTILFFNNLDLSKNNEKIFNFELLVQFQKEKIPGEFGLAFPNKNENNYNIIKKTNILNQLKENNLINNYDWFLLYDNWNDTEGKLIIGDSPHNLFPKKYSKKDLYFMQSLIDFSSGHNWRFKFNDIYLESFHLQNLTTELLFDTEIIIAPKELDILLLKYFLQEEINNKNCFHGRFYLKSHYITTLKYYYCNINIKNELYDIMPNINFKSKEFDYTFEIKKNDLLQTDGNYIFFKILFFIEDYNRWVLGKPFTLKYQFVFNSDNKQMGFYNPNYNKHGKNKIFISKKFLFIFFIIILCIIFTILGIILGKKIYGIKRKQKANELIDDFEYISSRSRNNININDIKNYNDYSINNAISKYINIEMNSNLY